MSLSFTYVDYYGNNATATYDDPSVFDLQTPFIPGYYTHSYYKENFRNRTSIAYGHFVISRNRTTGKLCCHIPVYSKHKSSSYAYVYFLQLFGDIASFVSYQISGTNFSPKGSQENDKYMAMFINAVGADYITHLEYGDFLSYIADNFFTVGLQPAEGVIYSDGSYTKIDTKLDKIIKKYSTFK